MGLRLGIAIGVMAATAVPFGAPAAAATVTAQVQAQVVKPLAITKKQDLNLGTIVLGPGTWSGAIVRLSRAAVLTCPANVTCGRSYMT